MILNEINKVMNKENELDPLYFAKLKRTINASDKSRMRINHNIEVGAKSSENNLTIDHRNRIMI